MLGVLYRHATFGWARISPAAGAAKTLSFCLMVTVSSCALRCVRALLKRNLSDESA